MDNAQKAIMIGVGLFITIIIISVVLLITTTGTNLANNATESVGTMSTTLQNSLKTSYDYKMVTGAEVKSLYDQYKNTKTFLLVFDMSTSVYYNDDGYDGAIVEIEAETKYYVIKSGGSVSPSGITTAASTVATTIKSSDQYRTYLIYDANEENVVGVYAKAI